MDLSYKILIIDDTREIIDNYTDELQQYMEELGFLLTVDSAESKCEFNNRDYDYESYDMFMIDLNFGSNPDGLFFIQEIRKKCAVADILFYSSDSLSIKKQRENKEFEGIYFAQRDDVIDEIMDKAKLLLKKAIKKSETSIGIRGLVLQNMSHCDYLVKEKIKCLHEKCDAESGEKILNKYVGSINESNTNKFNYFLKKIGYTDKKIDFIDKNNGAFVNPKCSIEELYDDYKISDSYTNFHLLKRITTKLKIDNEELESLYIYLSEVRNILAHSKVEFHNQVLCFRKKDGGILIMNDEKCIEIRINLIKYINLLKSLEFEKVANK